MSEDKNHVFRAKENMPPLIMKNDHGLLLNDRLPPEALNLPAELY